MGTVQWRPYMNFTAQSTALRAFYLMISRLEKGELSEGEYPSVIVFMAFSLEAYLNTLGARQVTFWSEIERLPWRTKIEILHEVAGAKPSWGDGPLQFAARIFKFRDQLAHGKPERVCGEWVPGVPDGTHREMHKAMKPTYMKDITSQWLLNSADQFRILMTYLGGLFDYHESDHLRNAEGGYDIDDGVD
ncbi:hypothetical protein Q1W70_18875 [Pseudomonas kielensis]|uniref:hypothetical protein n=1 Tax=Pseudomonas TaxID=286 RepID=UPI00141315E9|nr:MULTISPECIES: hypothetical protein [Pseudomonas]NBB36608.1 hypothetical protein [Pseudomonas sp. BC115LW]WKL51528.1 hypothetical protein Q1W70_18875 [Pseudomonas kielensis]